MLSSSNKSRDADIQNAANILWLRKKIKTSQTHNLSFKLDGEGNKETNHLINFPFLGGTLMW
jgi:hypothetical protein